MPKRFVLGGVSLGGGIVPGIAVARAKGGQASPKVSAALNNSRLHQFARRNLKFFVGICPLELAPSAKGLTMLNDSHIHQSARRNSRKIPSASNAIFFRSIEIEPWSTRNRTHQSSVPRPVITRPRA
jgi:hypothetical protein